MAHAFSIVPAGFASSTVPPPSCPPPTGSVAGIWPSAKPKILLGQDVNWPPYAYIFGAEKEFSLAGFGADVARGTSAMCDYDIEPVQTTWYQCYTDGECKDTSRSITMDSDTSGKISCESSYSTAGKGIRSGEFHACTVYTATYGVRTRFLDFSHAILDDNKPAGFLTRLVDGAPHVAPTDDLSDKIVYDVSGWAPTGDTVTLNTNACTGKRYATPADKIMVPPSDGNDAAMKTLLDGTADALYIYADQVANIHEQCQTDPAAMADSGTDCSLWDGLGTEYAYVGTGLLTHARNGTTLTISKKGSGLPALVNPCIEKFMRTKEYYDLCEYYELTSDCYPNEFFPASASTKTDPWLKLTTEQTPGCSDGYCDCSAPPARETDDINTDDLPALQG